MKTATCVTFLFLSYLALVYGTVIKMTKCGRVSDEFCRVKEARISPCENGRICVIKKGENYTLSFDFVPTFATDKLQTTVFYVNGNMELPFAELSNADGCQYTTCPLVPGTTQELVYRLRPSKLLPSGKFPFKWELWNTENTLEKCCFMAQLRLRK